MEAAARPSAAGGEKTKSARSVSPAYPGPDRPWAPPCRLSGELTTGPRPASNIAQGFPNGRWRLLSDPAPPRSWTAVRGCLIGGHRSRGNGDTREVRDADHGHPERAGPRDPRVQRLVRRGRRLVREVGH